MSLNIDDLKNLKDSDDFEYIKKVLIKLKKVDFKSKNYEAYIKAFQHYRLQMKTEYICDTYLSYEGLHIINQIINETMNWILRAFEYKYK